MFGFRKRVGITVPEGSKVKRRWLIVSLLVAAMGGLGINAAFADPLTPDQCYEKLADNLILPGSPDYNHCQSMLIGSVNNPIPDTPQFSATSEGECSVGGILNFNPTQYIRCELNRSASAAGRLLDLAFNNPLTQISGQEWAVAFSQAARWGGAIAPIAMALCVLEIISGVFAKNNMRIIKAAAFIIGAWPLTTISLLIFSWLANAGDIISQNMLRTAFGNTGIAGYTGAGIALGSAIIGPIITGTLTGLGGWIIAAAIIGALIMLGLGITIILGAVSFGLIVLAAFSPLAIMLMVFKGTRVISMKWVEAVVGLLLVKPVIAGIFTLCIALMSAGGPSGWVAGLVGLMLAASSPFTVMKFVNFAGVQLGAAKDAGGLVKGALKSGEDAIKGFAGVANENVALENESKQLAMGAKDNSGESKLTGLKKPSHLGNLLKNRTGKNPGGNPDPKAGSVPNPENPPKEPPDDPSLTNENVIPDPIQNPTDPGRVDQDFEGGETEPADGDQPKLGERTPKVTEAENPVPDPVDVADPPGPELTSPGPSETEAPESEESEVKPTDESAPESENPQAPNQNETDNLTPDSGIGGETESVEARIGQIRRNRLASVRSSATQYGLDVRRATKSVRQEAKDNPTGALGRHWSNTNKEIDEHWSSLTDNQREEFRAQARKNRRERGL